MTASATAAFTAEIVKQLDEIGSEDPEGAHVAADRLVEMALGVLGGEEGQQVVAAVDRLRDRCAGFWYA